MKSKICHLCRGKIKGIIRAKYTRNMLLRQKYWCEKCYIHEGRPKPIHLSHEHAREELIKIEPGRYKLQNS